MSADMMIISQEDNSCYDGNTEEAFFIDETSMGDPWHEFGKWFQSRFCGAPGFLEQLHGIKEHNYTEIKGSDIVAVKDALARMNCHESLDKDAFIGYMEAHIGKHISTQNW